MKIVRTEVALQIIFFLFLLTSCAKTETSSPKVLTLKKERAARVEDYSIASGEDSISFPLVKLTDTDDDAREIELKINSFLQAERLGGIAPQSKIGSLIKKVMPSNGTTSGLNTLGYQVLRNDGRILTLLMFEDWETAHPNEYYTAYSFDLTTGNPITWHSLFDAEGYEHVKSLILQKRRHAIAEGLQLIKEQPKIATINGDTAGMQEADTDGFAEDFERCIDQIDEDHIEFTDSTIVTNGQTCLSYVEHALDIDWATEIPLPSIKSYLNDYGKWLFHLTNTSFASPVKPASYFLTGTIDKYPVTAELIYREEDSAITGFYYYDSKGISIDLYGKFSIDQTLELEEYGESSGAQSKHPTWRGSLKNNTFIGTWTDGTGKKSLPVKLHYR